jgi:hypothetical protein
MRTDLLWWRRPRPSSRAAGARRRVCLQLERLEEREVLSASANDAFVSLLYQQYLGRAPDASGLAYWTNLLNSGTSRQSVTQFILSSDEFRADQVNLISQTYLGHSADAATASSLVGQLQNGSTFEQIKADVLGSDEFFGDAGGTNDAFLSALVQEVLGRSVNATDQSTWGAQLQAGTSRTTVALGVLQSAEAAQVEVSNAYTQILARQVDPIGLQFWSQMLQDGTRDEDVIAGIVGSSEFFQRFQNFLAQDSQSDPNAAALDFLLTSQSSSASTVSASALFTFDPTSSSSTATQDPLVPTTSMTTSSTTTQTATTQSTTTAATTAVSPATLVPLLSNRAPDAGGLNPTPTSSPATQVPLVSNRPVPTSTSSNTDVSSGQPATSTLNSAAVGSFQLNSSGVLVPVQNSQAATSTQTGTIPPVGNGSGF